MQVCGRRWPIDPGSSRTDEEITAAARLEFEILDFRRISVGTDSWGYQALVLQVAG
jgi:hypothetical protein